MFSDMEHKDLSKQLVSGFEILTFRMLYFVKNNRKILLQWRWGLETLKASRQVQKVEAFYVWRENNSLK